ncbi:FMN-binding negative transcriptional regulator [Priestia sp. Y58]|uniref:FMN-binding negative transcriptional regulator n=1 Tax=unclassified Priestia TaxID=2800374 RepID=UPI002405B0D2|nr:MULTISPECIES: FMN-binding negative transcriptional regulator [unclassified Priestia]MDG0029688.1 FMN-binding negative transcriptional regulator [Priestia sp. Y58]MDG0058522.1 FMN-binding negative transcriptional regulator [Priestia sp. P5]
MYIPKHFKMNDEQIMYDFIEDNGFATLFSYHHEKPYATHLPLMLNRKEGTLSGHFARPNQQWKDAENQEILVVFQGPHCYISPSWYETNQAVPTWNYEAVHVYGTMKMIEEPKELLGLLSKMVAKYESPKSTYTVNEVDSAYINGLSKGIVGFKIDITNMEGKQKLSQNHSVERQQLVIEKLEQTSRENEQKVAELMKQNVQHVLKK